MQLRYKIAGTVLGLLLFALAGLALTLSHTSPCAPSPALAAGATSMRAVTYRCYGSPDVIEVADVEKPRPGDDEVLVRVRAAAVNPLDWHYLRGSPYIMRLGTGLGKPEVAALGVDYAGTVEAVGKDVTRFKPGDDVFGGRTGAYGEYVAANADRAIAHMPANLTFAQAAAVPVAGVTALQALRDKGKVKAGQKVLINGASGGVGTFAVQIAKSLGAEVTGVCSTRNVELVRSLGADHVIDYKQETFTGSGQRYDVIIDNVGNLPLLSLRDALVPGGIVVMVGGPGGNWVGPLSRPLKAMFMGPFIDETFAFFISDLNPKDLNVLGELMASGRITPVIDRHYRFDEVPDAIAYSEQGHARGKIVIDMQ